MKRIYVCAPYSGATPQDVALNRENARLYAAYVMDHRKGADSLCPLLPFCPHLYFHQVCDEDTGRDLVMRYCVEEVRRSDEVWVFGSALTDGMKQEITAASLDGKPVRFVADDVALKGVF